MTCDVWPTDPAEKPCAPAHLPLAAHVGRPDAAGLAARGGDAITNQPSCGPAGLALPLQHRTSANAHAGCAPLCRPVGQGVRAADAPMPNRGPRRTSATAYRPLCSADRARKPRAPRPLCLRRHQRGAAAQTAPSRAPGFSARCYGNLRPRAPQASEASEMPAASPSTPKTLSKALPGSGAISFHIVVHLRHHGVGHGGGRGERRRDAARGHAGG